MSGMRARGWRRQGGAMDVTLGVRPGLRALLTTRRRAELRGGFMRLIAVSRAVRRIIELTGAHEALAVERIATDRSA